MDSTLFCTFITLLNPAGMGLPILLDIIRVTEPTHVIQFSSSSQPNKNLAVLTHEFLADASGWAFPLCEDNNSSTKGNASLLRFVGCFSSFYDCTFIIIGEKLY